MNINMVNRLICENFSLICENNSSVSPLVAETLKSRIQEVFSCLFNQSHSICSENSVKLSKICKKYENIAGNITLRQKGHQEEVVACDLLQSKCRLNEVIEELRSHWRSHSQEQASDTWNLLTFDLFQVMKTLYTQPRSSFDFEEPWKQLSYQLETEKVNGFTVLEILEEVMKHSKNDILTANCKVVLRTLEFLRCPAANVYAAREEIKEKLTHVEEIMQRYMTQPNAGALRYGLEDLWGGRASNHKIAAMEFWHDYFGQNFTASYDSFLKNLYEFLNIKNPENLPLNRQQSLSLLLSLFVLQKRQGKNQKVVDVGLWVKFCTLIGQPERGDHQFLERCQSFLVDTYPYLHLADPDPDGLVKNQEPGTYLVRWSRINCTFVLTIADSTGQPCLIKLKRLNDDGQLQYEFDGERIEGTLKEIIEILHQRGKLKKAIPGIFDQEVKKMELQVEDVGSSLSTQLSVRHHRISQARTQIEGGKDKQVIVQFLKERLPFETSFCKKAIGKYSKTDAEFLKDCLEKRKDWNKKPTSEKFDSWFEKNQDIKIPKDLEIWFEMFGKTPRQEIDKALMSIYQYCDIIEEYPEEYAQETIKQYKTRSTPEVSTGKSSPESSNAILNYDCLFQMMKIVALRGKNYLDLEGWRDLYDCFGPLVSKRSSFLDNCQAFVEKNHLWFHGKNVDPRVLEGHPDGSFLLRFSQTAVTFTVSLVKNQNNCSIRMKNHASEGLPGKYSCPDCGIFTINTPLAIEEIIKIWMDKELIKTPVRDALFYHTYQSLKLSLK